MAPARSWTPSWPPPASRRDHRRPARDSPEALAIAPGVPCAEPKLVEALQASQMRAPPASSPACSRPIYLDRARYWPLVGEVKRRRPRADPGQPAAGSIPVIASLGETVGGQILNVPTPTSPPTSWRQVLQPYKIVFHWLDRYPADRTASDRLDQLVHRVRHLMQQHCGSRRHAGEDRADQADLLDGLPLASSVSITRPAGAGQGRARNTHKGSGAAALRRAAGGDTVGRLRPAAAVRADRVGVRAQAARPLETTVLHRAYVSENYRAAVILAPARMPAPTSTVCGRRAGRPGPRGLAGDARANPDPVPALAPRQPGQRVSTTPVRRAASSRPGEDVLVRPDRLRPDRTPPIIPAPCARPIPLEDVPWRAGHVLIASASSVLAPAVGAELIRLLAGIPRSTGLASPRASRSGGQHCAHIGRNYAGDVRYLARQAPDCRLGADAVVLAPT